MPLTLQPLAHAVKLTDVSQRALGQLGDQEPWTAATARRGRQAEQGTHGAAILAVMCLSLLVVVIDNTILNTALPTLARVLHGSTYRPAVDHRRLHTDLRRAAGDGRRARRSLWPPDALLARPCHLRRRIGLGRPVRRLRHPDRRPRADGRRRGVRHARDTVDPDRGVPDQGASRSHQCLVSHRWHRHRRRTDAGRPAAGPLLLGLGLLGERAPRRCRGRRRHHRGAAAYPAAARPEPGWTSSALCCPRPPCSPSSTP